MKEKIAEYQNEKELICISYSDNAHEIVWEKEGKEFFYNNKLYDIVRTDTIEGKIFLYCVNDDRENKVITQNAETAKTNNTPGKKSGISKIELPLLFFAEHSCISSDPSGGEQITVLYKSTLYEGNEDNESPPPKAYPV